jgi:anhydro-N-acetylmuramic acid kinase
MPAELYVGLMSGTSLDGVDAALAAFDGDRIECLATHYIPFPDDLRNEALAIQVPGENELHRAALLANRLADIYAKAVANLLAESAIPAASVRAVGCHGQTIRHAPADGYTIQLVNPTRLAEACGITVIADFRSRDVAAGGQGAPLLPAMLDAAFRHTSRHRAILNIGGIANLADLAPGNPTCGFDCGPGNMLMDAWTTRHLGKAYDTDGAWAVQGHILPELLAKLRQNPFFELQPPKSCGREEFGIHCLEFLLSGNETPVDVQATLLEFTAATIADAVKRWCGTPEELFVYGGGARNGALMARLAHILEPIRVAPTDVLGLPADWVEAVAFAWLARRTQHNLPGNLPSVTGARGPRILGAIYPA